ncbi:UDP-3-O-(3-hydroxymyristoyl)glucosamine N-acyltransferase [candidate division CSSED10-310 bacterium]|uniref:UDP-3-O-acylglucosamine N-acyltransferase n=1 Tax=candidate division CSSED10-310 bacterium TaxID=2855610 RepID=A0ABV6YY23_UNCC1
MALSVHHIAEKVGCSFRGDGETLISGIAPLETAQAKHISFLANPKYARLLDQSAAGCIIISENLTAIKPGTYLLARNPYYIFALVSQLFYQPVSTPDGISPDAVLEEEVQIGNDCSISPFVYLARGARIGDRVTVYPHVYIGQNSIVGDGTLIYPNVTIRENVTIGKRVIIHSSTVIGSDGYGFAQEGERHYKIPQTGEVIIEDDVELGAGVTIDRGTLGPTRIGRGTKCDNQVHIAHNVTVGDNSLLIAQVGISGSSKIGKSVTIAGQSGLVGHITIGDRTIIAAASSVTKSFPAGSMISGLIPARDHKKAKRTIASLFRLPNLINRVNSLEKILKDKGLMNSGPTKTHED